MTSGSSKAVADGLENTGLFYAILKSIREFNEMEVKGVLHGQLNTTDRENCFLASYWRAVDNVESLLALTDVKHFQAISMLARAQLELATDIRLMDVVQDAGPKVIAHSRLEKLRAARGVLSYEKTHILTIS
jgi:hypothetical protein